MNFNGLVSISHQYCTIENVFLHKNTHRKVRKRKVKNVYLWWMIIKNFGFFHDVYFWRFNFYSSLQNRQITDGHRKWGFFETFSRADGQLSYKTFEQKTQFCSTFFAAHSLDVAESKMLLSCQFKTNKNIRGKIHKINCTFLYFILEYSIRYFHF